MTGISSDADFIHGAGKTGRVMHRADRANERTSTSARKGPDGGMSATLGRPKSTSDYPGPTPEGHVVAPGQRTVDSPDSGYRAHTYEDQVPMHGGGLGVIPAAHPNRRRLDG
jgi:hypothetical protein